MLILNKTQINILVDVHFLIPTFQVVLIHINKVGNRINKVGHETTKWVNESTKWVNESTSWTAPNQPRGSRQLYDHCHDHRLREGPLCVFPWAGTNSCFISCSTKVIILKTFFLLMVVAVLSERSHMSLLIMMLLLKEIISPWSLALILMVLDFGWTRCQ